jgi:hypothetical protein
MNTPHFTIYAGKRRAVRMSSDGGRPMDYLVDWRRPLASNAALGGREAEK